MNGDSRRIATQLSRGPVLFIWLGSWFISACFMHSSSTITTALNWNQKSYSLISARFHQFNLAKTIPLQVKSLLKYGLKIRSVIHSLRHVSVNWTSQRPSLLRYNHYQSLSWNLESYSFISVCFRQLNLAKTIPLQVQSKSKSFSFKARFGHR